MDQLQLNTITNFIWNIADDVLRDVYVRGKYRDVILPMTVLRADFQSRFDKSTGQAQEMKEGALRVL
jgi:type I restriction-modification system DNA methylase subunit